MDMKLEYVYYKCDIEMINKYMAKHSSLVNWEMKTKTIVS